MTGEVRQLEAPGVCSAAGEEPKSVGLSRFLTLREGVETNCQRCGAVVKLAKGGLIPAHRPRYGGAA